VTPRARNTGVYFCEATVYPLFTLTSPPTTLFILLYPDWCSASILFIIRSDLLLLIPLRSIPTSLASPLFFFSSYRTQTTRFAQTLKKPRLRDLLLVALAALSLFTRLTAQTTRLRLTQLNKPRLFSLVPCCGCQCCSILMLLPGHYQGSSIIVHL
jgi:hypothetical protein